MKPLNKALIVLIPGFPVNEADTTCLPAQQLLIRKINKLLPSLEIIIIAFQHPFYNKEYVWFGNRVIPFNGANKGGISQKILWLKVFSRLNKLRKQKNIIGVFSCWCTECALVGKYFSERNNLQHYIWICGQDARANNKLVKRIQPKPDSLIAISKAVQNEFLKNHKILPKYIIENGIDTNVYANESIEKEIDILGVGSLIPLKQFEILIDVVAHLKNIKPNIKAVICGDGKEKNKLTLMIENLHLENNIMLAGERPHDEILVHMQRSKILLHPSSYEGFSGVCIEALYAGAHVISFCNPAEQSIKHWHIVNDVENMYQKAFEILNDVSTDYSSVLVNDMETSVAKLMRLYNTEL
jgi:glycosyltransferase involved in cell wall biosynthesis